jgi:hypothetical protein
MAAGLTGGHDPFTGKQIVRPLNKGFWAISDMMNYTMRQFGPSLISPFGFSFNKLAKSFTQEFAGRPDVPTPFLGVLSEVFGVKIRPLEPRQALGFKALSLTRELRKGDDELERIFKEIPTDDHDAVALYLRGDRGLDRVPKRSRGKAKSLKRKIGVMQKNIDEFNKKFPREADLPEQTEAFKKAIRGQ